MGLIAAQAVGKPIGRLRFGGRGQRFRSGVEQGCRFARAAEQPCVERSILLSARSASVRFFSDNSVYF